METMQTPNERLVRVHEVMDRCGLAQSTLYEQIKQGRFPKPVKIRLGGKSRSAARWRESDVRAWIAEQIKASHSAGPIGTNSHLGRHNKTTPPTEPIKSSSLDRSTAA